MNEMSYRSGTNDFTLLTQCIGNNLKSTCEKFPDSDALIMPFQEIRFTYSQLWENVELVAKALIHSGIQKGERVGIWAPNCYEWVLTQYATARVGAILVNINPAYKEHELQFALHQSKPRMIISAKEFRSTDYVGILHKLAPDAPFLDRVVFLGEDWANWLESGAGTDANLICEREKTLDPHDPINIQYTSGTTGSPKGATLSHHNILNNAYLAGVNLRYTNTDRVCIPVPFYHCFGMVLGNLACTSHGAAMVIPDQAFDAEQTLKTVIDENCTSLYGVPTMFFSILDHPKFAQMKPTTLRTGIMAGSLCPEALMKRVKSELGMNELTIGYGMTETSPLSTITSPDDSFEKSTQTVGRVLPFTEIKIVCPETNETKAIGEKGEFCAKGYLVMKGYWENTEATNKSIDSDGWMHSGDLATMDEDGYVSIVGRLKDMIIRGGENIYPKEIEEFLHQHPDVGDVHIIGISDEKYGEVVGAFIKSNSTDLSGDNLYNYCKGKIASYKIPLHWFFVDEFPMTVTGKIQKFKLREMAEKQLVPVAAPQ